VLNRAPPKPSAIDVTATTGTTIYATERTYATYVMVDSRSTLFSPYFQITAGAPIADSPRNK
jgi:hypothetical protein